MSRLAQVGGPKGQVTKVHEPAQDPVLRLIDIAFRDPCGRAAAAVVRAQSVSAAVIIEQR